MALMRSPGRATSGPLSRVKPDIGRRPPGPDLIMSELQARRGSGKRRGDSIGSYGGLIVYSTIQLLGHAAKFEQRSGSHLFHDLAAADFHRDFT
jgi:hypothetical protein